MKKMKMEYEPFIYTIIFYLILCTKFRKEFLMLSLPEELLIFARNVFSYGSAICRYKYDLN